MIPSTTHRGVKVEIKSAEFAKKFNGNSSPKGKKLLILNVSLENESREQVIIFPQEEFFLAVGKETLPLENYKLEGNLDPGQKSEGRLLFLVPGGISEYVLRLEKGTERSKIDISISNYTDTPGVTGPQK